MVLVVVMPVLLAISWLLPVNYGTNTNCYDVRNILVACSLFTGGGCKMGSNYDIASLFITLQVAAPAPEFIFKIK